MKSNGQVVKESSEEMTKKAQELDKAIERYLTPDAIKLLKFASEIQKSSKAKTQEQHTDDTARASMIIDNFIEGMISTNHAVESVIIAFAAKCAEKLSKYESVSIDAARTNESVLKIAEKAGLL